MTLTEKERHQQETNQLMSRASRCVCKLCGGKLEPSMIIYNKYGGQGLDLYCPQCQKTEYGTEPAIFNLAKNFVDTFEFNYYLDMEENERNSQLNIAKICEIMAWTLKTLSLLDYTGLKDNPPDFSPK